ncbi:MAG: prepilin-type N-terminal cleavage/methylation domain-containing protein [Candidatus Pacebacteria bacterium]|nr:prepilin-type N-terminal cleavage/methylation domain-containing protein [Candidatus Paceibacterota bacterium]
MSNNLEKGLTLVEMFIVIAIAAVLTTIVFGNYGKGKESLALERAGQKLLQDVRRTQELAMSGAAAAGVNACGIYFDKTSGHETEYIIYDNVNANYYYESATDSAREAVDIESGIKICDVKDNGVSGDTISVSFMPPEPVTRIDSNYSGHEATIILCIASDVAKTRTVKINNLGRIDVANP